jgi:hypothetical protein
MLLALAAAPFGYWTYVNQVPEATEAAAPEPNPNGYVAALEAGTKLDEVRSAFSLEWQVTGGDDAERARVCTGPAARRS